MKAKALRRFTSGERKYPKVDKVCQRGRSNFLKKLEGKPNFSSTIVNSSVRLLKETDLTTHQRENSAGFNKTVAAVEDDAKAFGRVYTHTHTHRERRQKAVE